MSSPNKRFVHGLKLGVALLLVVGALAVVFNRQMLQDRITVMSYHPSAQVAALADNAGMSEYGRFMFYVGTPEISSAEAFNEQCQRQERSSVLLGCYNGQQIYIYDVTNPEIKKIQEVTAAHEMLHIVWDRLPAAKQESLRSLLEAQYKQSQTPELDERMAYYERQQPGERDNELHSILGTEVAPGSLSPELEDYYKEYFSDRGKVTVLHEKYSAIFADLKAQATSLQASIQEMASSINSDIAQYNASMGALNQAIAAHNEAGGAIDKRNEDAVWSYNNKRAALLNQAASLEVRKQAIEQAITDYQAKLKEYNALAVRSSELSSSIDSFSSPQGL